MSKKIKYFKSNPEKTKEKPNTAQHDEHRKKRIKFERWKEHALNVLDIVILGICITIAGGLMSFSKQIQNSHNRISFVKPKPKAKAKHQKIPKAETICSDVYEFVPKKTVQKYKTAYDYYGNPYKKKVRHPKITYHANFYLDPNYASKSDLVERPIYILITGGIIKKPKTLKTTQVAFNDSTLAFDMKKHFVLNDSNRYIYVMQFVSFRKYNEKLIPNSVTKGFNQISAVGSNRYLKLNEYKIVRLKKENVSRLAASQQLFCEYTF